MGKLIKVFDKLPPLPTLIWFPIAADYLLIVANPQVNQNYYIHLPSYLVITCTNFLKLYLQIEKILTEIYTSKLIFNSEPQILSIGRIVL